ncbi:transposase [Roseibacillus ishigakijimensis]|uniref:transposase n=1 Tax=Roseibacillus ishigakijimensis TaxID=454146 RepID=UPI00363B0BCB
MPGAGPVFAARLLSFFRTDRSVFPDSASLQRLSGVAPLTKQSGKMHFVHRRYGCNKFWRQTFVEKSRRLVGFLDRSASDEPRRGETPWGGVESMGRSNGYQIPLGKGLLSTALGATERLEFHRHQSILRSLAYEWQRILFSCWKNREKYDERRYLKALEKSNSPLLKTIETIKKTHPKLGEQFS